MQNKPGLTFIITLLCITRLANTSWWYLALVGVADQPTRNMKSPTGQPRSNSFSFEERCNSMNFLNRAQKRFCSRSAAIPGLVGQGAQWGIEECQRQFKNRKWNCTTFRDTSLFGHVLKINSREKAFIYAISSAGVMLSITKACARGQLEICGCDRRKFGPPRKYVAGKKRGPRSVNDYAALRYQNANSWEDVLETNDNVDNPDTNANESTTWQWGGCSHDVKYGARFTRRFIDSMEDRNTPEGLMNLWNNRAGRRAVKKTMGRSCKCHGVSGACTVQVCWRVVGDLNTIGSVLLKHYDGASKMRSHPRRKRRLITYHRSMKKPSRQDLVYLDDSPNYCKKNIRRGSLGTQGRECSVQTKDRVGSCNVMCCNRGHFTLSEEVEEDCDCKFEWCCRVVCRKCRKTVVRNYCL